MLAVDNNHKECVEYLSQYETGLSDGEGKTALIHAVINNRPEMIQFLVKEIKQKDKTNRTAMYYACYYGYADCTKQLMDEVGIADNSF